jgi:hypothetical protein
MARADTATSRQGYIDLAGETFREEEALLEARLFGRVRAEVIASSPSQRTESPVPAGLSAAKGTIQAAGVRFELTGPAKGQRFSRPPRSTAPAPRRRTNRS